MNASIKTPRGQIVTIVGIVASVVMNLVILLVTVLAGDWIVGILPAVVIASFSFVMAGLFGCMIIMRWDGEDGIVKGFINSLPYLVLAIIIKIISSKVAALMTWGMALSVGACILLAYVFYKRDCKKAGQ